MPLNEDIFDGNSKPHRDRGSVESEQFDARLALAPRHLRVKHFSSRDSKKVKFKKGLRKFEKLTMLRFRDAARAPKCVPSETTLL